MQNMHHELDACLERGLAGVIGDGSADELAAVYQVHARHPLLEGAPPSCLLYVAQAAKHTRESLLALRKIPHSLPLF